MIEARLSATPWQTPRDVHLALKEALDFPDYYGCNLDALFDCLTCLGDTQLLIANCDRAARAMPEKWPGFVRVFMDAAAKNPRLRITLFPGSTDWDGE